MIVEIDAQSLAAAAAIHSESWQNSHESFCSAEFVAQHTPRRQERYLAGELRCGKQIYMLVEHMPVGIVSVCGDLIENLYVLPGEQRKGYGTKLLLFAIKKCRGAPRLWVLGNNSGAYALYARHGFKATGREHKLAEGLFEVELSRQQREEQTTK